VGSEMCIRDRYIDRERLMSMSETLLSAREVRRKLKELLIALLSSVNMDKH